MKSKFKRHSTFEILTILIGFMSLILSLVYFGQAWGFSHKSKEVKAEITNIKKQYNDEDQKYDYSVFVKYDIGQQEYNNIKIDEFNQKMYVGKVISLYYMKSEPNKVFTKNNLYTQPLLLLLLGLISFLISKQNFVSKSLKKLKRIYLKWNRYIIVADITDIIINSNKIIAGRNPIKIKCTFFNPVTKKQQKAESPEFCFMEDKKTLKKVPVYIEAKIGKKIYIDYEKCSIE